MNITNLKGKVILIINDMAGDSPAPYTTDLADKIATWYGGDVIELFSHDYENIEENLSDGHVVIFESRELSPEGLETLKELAKTYNGIIILDRLGHKENFGLMETADIVLMVNTELEVFKDRYNDTKFLSGRSIELITQSTQVLKDSQKYEGILTVENSDIWYNLFIIRPDNTVDVVHDTLQTLFSALGVDESLWKNNCVNPKLFHQTAKKLNLYYDDETFAKVCELFVVQVLGDWGKLKDYLPEQGDTI